MNDGNGTDNTFPEPLENLAFFLTETLSHQVALHLPRVCMAWFRSGQNPHRSQIKWYLWETLKF